MIWCVCLNPALDIAWRLSATRRSRDAVTLTDRDCRPGGKGNNAARIARQLGSPVTAVGMYGGPVGACISGGLRALGIDTVSVPIPVSNRICLTLVAPDGGVTEFREVGPVVNPAVGEALLEQVEPRLQPEDWVTLSGSLPSGWAPEIYGQWVTVLKARAAGVIVDTAGPNLEAAWQAVPTAVVPNAEEFQTLAQTGPLPQPLRTQILVTRGADGVEWYHDGTPVTWRAPRIAVVNPIGAGDAFLGALVAALHARQCWEQAIPWAVAVASATCTTLGVADLNVPDAYTLWPQVTREPS